MNENLQFNDLPIPAEAGWQHMRMMLDEHMPVKKQLSFRRQFIFYFAAAIFVVVLLSISLQLDQSLIHLDAATIVRSEQPVKSSNVAETFSFNQPADYSNNSCKALAYTTSKKSNTSILTANKNYPTFNAINRADEILTADAKNCQRLTVAYPDKILLAGKRSIAVINFPETISKLPSMTSSSIKKAKRLWSLSVGLGSNIHFNASQNYQPYPTAEVLYHLTPKLFIAAGLDVYVPATNNAKGINKTVYINDLVNNIRLYNQVTTYSHLHYANVPVTAGIKLAKNVSFQTGVQASILVNKKTNQALEPYDYQDRLSMGAIAPPVTAAAMPQQDYVVSHQSIDYKLLAGLHYNTGNLTLALSYQHGMKPLLTGDKVNSTPARSVALKVLVKIK
ncbi:hypothetical protein BH11BAC3_BH11BAC3_21570 [soil metagenome]